MAYYSLPKIKPPTPQVPQRATNNRERRAGQLQGQQDQLDEKQRQQALSQLPVSAFFPQPPQPQVGGLPPAMMPPVRRGGGLGELPMGMQPRRLPGFDDGGAVTTYEDEEDQGAYLDRMGGWLGTLNNTGNYGGNFVPDVRLDPSQINDVRALYPMMFGREDIPLRSDDSLRGALNYDRGYRMPDPYDPPAFPSRLPGVRGFDDGGDVYGGYGGNPEEDEDYQRFLAEQAAAQEQVMLNQYKALVADPATAQMITQYNQPGNIPQEAAPYMGTWDQKPAAGGEDTRLRQGGTPLGQLNTENPNRSGYGEGIGQRALPAALMGAVSTIPYAFEQVGNVAEKIGDLRLPAYSMPGGPGGPGPELQASRTISERAEQGLPYRPQIEAANEWLGEAGGKAGELGDKLMPFVPGGQGPALLNKATGIGTEDIGREVGSHLIPETYGQAAVYGAGALIGGGGPLERVLGMPGLDEAAGRLATRFAPALERAGARVGGLPGVRSAVMEGIRGGERGSFQLGRGDEADSVYNILKRDVGLVDDPAGRLAEQVRSGALTTDEAITRGQRMAQGEGVRGLNEPATRPSDDELRRIISEGQVSLPPVEFTPEPRGGPGGVEANPFPSMGEWAFDPVTREYGPRASLIDKEFGPGIPEERLISIGNGEQMSQAPELRGPPGGRPPAGGGGGNGRLPPGGPPSGGGTPPWNPAEWAFEAEERRPMPSMLLPQNTQPRSMEALQRGINELPPSMPARPGPPLVQGRYIDPAELATQIPERTGMNQRGLPDVMPMGGRSQPAVSGLFSGPQGLQLPRWTQTPGLPQSDFLMGGKTQPDVVGGFVPRAGSNPWDRNKGERISQLIREAQESGRPPGLPSQNLPGGGPRPVEQPLPNPGKLKLNDSEKFRVAQFYMTNRANDPVGSLTPNEISARLYNAGLESISSNRPDGTFSPPQLKRLTDRYEYADAQGIKMPPEEPPSGMPERLDLTPSQDVSKLTNAQAQEQARLLGFQLDAGVLEKGTREARDQELNLLRRATEDYESDVARGFNTPRQGLTGPAPSLEEESQRVIANNFAEDRKWFNDADAAQDVRQMSKNDEAEIARMEREGGGGGTGDPAQQALRDAPNESSIFSNLMGALYLPLSGDIGTALRQDAMRTLAPWHAAQTREVAGITARSMRSVEGAEAELAYLRELPGIKALGVKVEEADVMGTDLKNKETYVSDLLTKAPLGVGAVFGATNRGNAMWLNARRYLMVEDFIQRMPKASQAQVQHYSHFVSRLTGRGSVPQGLSGFGPLFTSLRYLTSIPERTSYLIPITKLADGKMDFFGPVWWEAVKEHASMAAVIFGSMGLAHEAGLQVGWDPSRQSAGPNGEPGFMSIRLGNSYIDLTGGAKGWGNVLYQMASGEKNGKPYPMFLDKWTDAKGKQYMGGTVGDFLRNKGGPLPSMIVELTKLSGQVVGVDVPKKLGLQEEFKYLRPDYFNQAFGSDNWKSRVASHLTPVYFQDLYDAIAKNGGVSLEGGFTRSDLAKAIALPLTMFGGGMQSYTREAYQTKGMRLDEEMNKDRDAVFGKDLATKIPETDRFQDLGSREKQLVTARLSPEELAQVQQKAIAEGDEVQKALFHQEHIKREFDDQFTSVRRELARGEITPYDGRQKINGIETKMRETMASVKFPELPESAKSQIQKAESGYRAIYSAVPPLPDGKPNYDVINRIQLNYLQAVQKSQGADFLGRLNANVQPRVGVTDHPAVKFYDTPEMRSAVTAYQRIPDNLPNSAEQKASFLIENPQRNALLYAGGQVGSLRTPAAMDAYRQYSAGVPEISFFAGYAPAKDNVSYNKLAVGSQAEEVRTYQGLPGDKRDDYLRAHPGLNVLMWQTGHTPVIYSVEAWNKVKK